MRKRDYLIVYESKIPLVLSMIKDTRLTDVATHTGVPPKVIVEACLDFGYEEYLVDEEKYPLEAEAFYDDFIPAAAPEETREERLARVRDAITSFQTNCRHDHRFCRCSRCMKVLGSELTFIQYSRVEDVLRKTVDDLSTDSVEWNEQLDLVSRTFMNNLYATDTAFKKE